MTSPPYFNQRRYGLLAEEIGKSGSEQEYVSGLVRTFGLVPLHERGSLWVNIGDKRASSGGLLMIPEKFALAMLADGWLLMDKVIWAKVVDVPAGTRDGKTSIGNCMIEPAPGRLNGNGWEYLFRFSRSRDPWSDTCSVRLPRDNSPSSRYLPASLMGTITEVEGKNRHNVWQMPMGQTRQRHFACYPRMLCEVPISMTCPMRVSLDGRTLEERLVENREYDEGKGKKRVFGKYTAIPDPNSPDNASGRMDTGKQYVPKKPVTTGWTDMGPEWSAGVVLDPFCGTGTTGTTALRLGRSFVGIDLYEEYAAMSRRACKETMAELSRGVNHLDVRS